MTKKETVNRNIGLTFDFVREIIKTPSIVNDLPETCEIEFIEKDFPIKNAATLNNKYIIKVKTAFEPVSKVAERKYNERFCNISEISLQDGVL